ncbi:major facilitator super transporter protein [Agyrium rufum]|nr:major facilitator super transporter protein [Agyrium rufum]
MPRVKAMTTGSIPSFLDVILNFAESDTSSTLASQDTWPVQLRRKPGGKLVMYGDDTWLKLFPGTFERADGTSSFFVSDFTEVDNNVTRHVPSELKQTDWNGMIMHYLGLDHIGHKTGPNSSNMLPKQIEMDGIVKQIYESIVTEPHLKSTLLVLAGDHGMNDAGNHGGSAPGETSPALVFISPKLEQISSGSDCPAKSPEDDFQYYTTVEQSDIVPTLAALLGFPIPLNNLGVLIPAFLSFWRHEETRTSMLNENVAQMSTILKAAYGASNLEQLPREEDCISPATVIDRLSCKLAFAIEHLSDSKRNYSESLIATMSFLRLAQEEMSSAASDYDVSKLYWGILLSAVAFILSLIAAVPHLRNDLTSLSFFSSTVVAYAVMMFASSYVEEEQQFWYWIMSGWLGILALKSINQKGAWSLASSSLFIGTLAVSRVIRCWNQTGQKHAGSDDIARGFLLSHKSILWVLVIAMYLDLFRRISRSGLPRIPRQAALIGAVAVSLAGFAFKVAFTKADAPELLPNLREIILKALQDATLVTQARTVFLGLAFHTAFILYQKCTASQMKPLRGLEIALPLHDLLTLFIVTQSRLTNIPLFLLFEIQFQLLLSASSSPPASASGISQTSSSPSDILLTTFLLQTTSFFATGNSNAISSIDLSNAYNGVSGYNAGAVGLLTFISNWAAPIWWASASALIIIKTEGERAKRIEVWRMYLTMCTVFVAAHLVAVTLACTVLRTHLFIWTVFSPKFLFSVAWSLGMHLLINIGMVGAVIMVAE